MWLRVKPNPNLVRPLDQVRYNGPMNPPLTYDVLVILKRRNASTLYERCKDASSVPTIGRNVGFRRLFGTVTDVVFKSDGPIEITLEYPKANRN